jgi:hypothetical protein
MLTGYGVRFPTKTKDFSLFHDFQTDSRVQTVSYKMGSGGSSPGVRRPGRETGFSTPSCPEGRMAELTSIPHTFLWLDALLMKNREIFGHFTKLLNYNKRAFI